MKNMLLFLVIVAPVVGWGQKTISMGGYAGIFDCNLDGRFTGVKSRTAWGGAMWVEWKVAEWCGLKSELSYLPRGGDVEDIGMEANYLAFSVVPRLHLSETSSRVRLVVGAGMFTHLLALGDREAFLNVPDVGACMELGVEWPLFSILTKGQIGFLDAVDGLDETQRWVAFGVGVEVPFVR